MKSHQLRLAAGLLLSLLAGIFACREATGTKQINGRIPGMIPVARVEGVNHVYQIADSWYGRHLLVDDRIRTRMDTLSMHTDMPAHGVLETIKFFFPSAGSMLILGLSDGYLAKSSSLEQWKVVVVDPEPESQEIARSYFFFDYYRGDVVVDEPRQFLKNSTGQFDAILIDGLRFFDTPEEYLTEEFFRTVNNRLSDSGVCGFQVELEGWHDAFGASVFRTLHRVFRHVLLLPMAEPPDQFGAVVFFASDRPLELSRPLDRDFTRPDYRYSLSYHRNHAWDNQFIPDTASAPLIVRGNNPSWHWLERIGAAERIATREYVAQRIQLW